MKKAFTFIAVIILCNQWLVGQSPYILNDINGTLMGTNVSFQKMANYNGVLIFQASSPSTGSELWKSDGTKAGTVLIKDINPGVGHSAVDNFLAINNIMYFVATDGIHGLELWKTDGTAAGTIMLKDIYVGSTHAYPSNLVDVNGTLFFTADDGITNGRELWKSNGTPEGTVLVKDILEGQWSSSPSGLTNVNGTLFFSAKRSDIELYKSDGTATGTVRVKNIHNTPGTNLSSMPSELTNVNGVLFFTADDGIHGRELWSSNGTEAGTQMRQDINPGPEDSNPTGITWVPETSSLYYAADDGVNGVELHSFNQLGFGIEANINPTGSSYPKDLKNIDGVLYFTANDGTHGIELWKSDFNLYFIEPTTSLVADINFGLADSNPRSLIKVNGQIYFSANDAVHGQEIWQTNGTMDGTLLFKDIYPGVGSSGAYHFTDITNGISHKLFFTAKPLDETTYPTYFWSLGYCGPISTLAIASKTALNQVIQSSTPSLTCFCDNTNNLITSVNSQGTSPVIGTIKSKVWIENTQPASYVKRHYEITPEYNPSNATGRITLYFTQAEFNDYNLVNTIKLPNSNTDFIGKANVLIEKRSGTSTDGSGLPNTYSGSPTIIDPADTDVVLNFSIGRWEISFDVQGFSGFFLTTVVTQNPLPIILINFTGKKVGEANQLNWQTSQEINASHFEIESSGDAKVFEKIGEVKANKSEIYEFGDNSALNRLRTPLNSSLIYYRLKLVDLDGKFTYSKIISITNESENQLVGQFYPNPAVNGTTTIDINSPQKKEWTISQFDISGKLLKMGKTVLEKGINKISIYNIDAGIHIFIFQSSKNIFYRKVLK